MRFVRTICALLVMSLAACGGGGGSNQPPPANQPPTADAGADQAVSSGSTVTLTSRGNDPDGAAVVFVWTQTSGPTVTLASTPSPSFCAPIVAASTVLTFSLTVSDNGGLSSAPDTMNVTVSPHAGGNATVSGRVTFARVPLATPPAQGLSYIVQPQQPSRGATVEVVCVGQVLASSTTDANGDYTLSVPSNINVAARAVAELRRPAAPPPAPQWQVSVRDADVAASAYTFTGAIFDSSAPAGAQNLAILSGWSSTGTVTGTRDSAPFAILDTIYKAIQLVLSVEPAANFPPLTVDWSTSNPGGVTFYSGGPSPRIVLPGEVNVDTDEYDEHVIAHEFGHFIEDKFSRSDSIGGPHAGGDLLDMRVAFGEGYGYAFGAMTLEQPLTRDTFGPGQASEGNFNIENNNWQNEGWFSEASNWSILWDLFDDTAIEDPIALGFGPLWDVLTDEQRTGDAFTSIFTFITALKQKNPAQEAQIDQIVAAQSIASSTMDAYGTNESNPMGGGADVLPIYETIVIGGGPKTVRSVATVAGVSGTGGNKLSNHRFLRLNVPSTQNVRFQVTAPAGRDADIFVYQQGVVRGFGQLETNEDFPIANLEPGDYVLDVYDCQNAECADQTSYQYQPTDITVTVSTN